jgi:hypothetical protein
MARPKTYLTEEDKKQAQRENWARYYGRKKTEINAKRVITQRIRRQKVKDEKEQLKYLELKGKYEVQNDENIN